jgi:hypothetical protein
VLREVLGGTLAPDMRTAQAQMSSSIRFSLEPMNVIAPFSGQGEPARSYLRHVERLVAFVKANRETIDALYERRVDQRSGGSLRPRGPEHPAAHAPVCRKEPHGPLF